MSLEDVVNCLQKIFSPLTSNADRTLCHQVTEDYKESGFKRKWAALTTEEKQEIRHCICRFVTNVDNMMCRNSESNAVCLSVTQILVHLIKCEWPQKWPLMISELINIGKNGILQSLVVFDIFRRLSEDILFFPDVPVKRRRELCAVLSDNVPQITNFALDSIFSAVKFHTSLEIDFNEDTVNALRSALMLLSTLFEWCNLMPLIEWRAPEQFPSSLETVRSIQLLLLLLRLPKLRIEAADILGVMLTKKQSDAVAERNKSVDNTLAYTHFFAFTVPSDQNPIDIILDISRSAFTMTEFDENACKFMRRWSEVISLLGTQVVDDWAYFEGKGPAALKAFDLLIQANVFAAAHPSRSFAISAGAFFKAVLCSKRSILLSLLAKYMPKLLPIWMDNMVIRSFPATTDPVSSWFYANCEKDDYSDFLTKTRSYVKLNCLLFSASLWPTEVLRYLIDWHKRMLGEVPKPEDLIISSQPFISRTSDLIRQWEALSFAMDKTVACAYSGNVLTSRIAAVNTPTPLTSPAEREAGQSILLAHIRYCFANTVADLPADPGMRQYYLSVLHTLVISCTEGSPEFALHLLMQDFATLRYSPYVVSTGRTAAVAAPKIPKYLNIRCQSVRYLHMCVGVNVFRLVRAQTSAMLPYFDSFCSELNDIWTNGHGGLGERCLLLEVIIYLALRLPCTFAEQREKLATILAGVLTEWNKSESPLVVFGAKKAESQEEEESKGGVDRLLEYFGLAMDADEILGSTDFLAERVATRLKLRWISLATVAIMRQLNGALSPEQMENVSVPLIETLVIPAFNLLRTLNMLWQPRTAQHCHPSMRSVLEVTYFDMALQANIKLKNPVKNSDPESLVTVVYHEISEDYMSKLQSFLAQLYEATIHICDLVLAITSSRFYALPTDQLNQLLYNYVCPSIDSMPDFRLLQLLRHLIIPYVRFCPAEHIGTAIVPLMPYILDALFQKVNKSWAVIKLVNKDEADEQEAVKEIFIEETVRSLSTSLIEITRTLLAFTGARARRSEDVDTEGAEAVEGETEQEGEMGVAAAASEPIEFGPVARAFLIDWGASGSGGRGEMFVRIASWLTAAVTWPDSKVCTKAATLLVKVIDYTLHRDGPSTHPTLPAELASQLLIGGLRALQTNGQFLSEVGPPLFNLVGRAVALIDGGPEGVTVHLEPILLSALRNCQDTTPASQHSVEIRKYTELVFNRTKTPSEKVLRERLKTLLKPIIGIPLAEQHNQTLSISALEPLRRPSLRSRRRQRQRQEASVGTRIELAVQALASLFEVNSKESALKQNLREMGELGREDITEYKEKLKTICGPSGLSLYDALKKCLRKFIAGECKDIQDTADFIEDFLNNEPKFISTIERQLDDIDLGYLREEKAVLDQFTKDSEPEDEDIIVQDIRDISNMLKCTGEGLDPSEHFKLKLAFKKIIADNPIESIRFWGKIFGTHNDYYIIECHLSNFDISEDNVKKEIVSEDTESNGRGPDEDPPLPKSIWKPPPETPSEEVGEGVNSRVYFVSNHPCGPYSRLPHAEPKHIVASRLIFSHFTGDLTVSVASFPPFPGTEAHYLRAQIARISAATHLAPRDFYRLRLDNHGGDEGEESEEMVEVECEENEEYIAQPVDEMELEQWVHCRPYILPQGRVTWWNPLDAESETESNGDSGDDTVPPPRGLNVESQPELGPPILTPITEDIEVQGQVPWTMRRYLGGLYLRVSSLLWPGAHTIAREGAFENIYVGWGLKATGPAGFQTSLPAVQCETLEEPVEQTDPTPEEEAAKEEEGGRDDEEDSIDNSDEDDDDKEEEED
ncbi:Radial spoke head protein 6 -like protein A [Echinococcus granulosus]|nr:Radial spoke head protein 6 -like protein A [Echinococcus granulosus]